MGLRRSSAIKTQRMKVPLDIIPLPDHEVSASAIAACRRDLEQDHANTIKLRRLDSGQYELLAGGAIVLAGLQLGLGELPCDIDPPKRKRGSAH